MSGIGITTIEHAVANVAHEISIGAKAVKSAMDKAEGWLVKDAPTIEALTSLVDPRAAVIERIGAALIGELEPQLSKVFGDVSTDAAAPTVTLTSDLFNELKSLYASLAGEITAAKAQVTT